MAVVTAAAKILGPVALSKTKQALLDKDVTLDDISNMLDEVNSRVKMTSQDTRKIFTEFQVDEILSTLKRNIRSFEKSCDIDSTKNGKKALKRIEEFLEPLGQNSYKGLINKFCLIMIGAGITNLTDNNSTPNKIKYKSSSYLQNYSNTLLTGKHAKEVEAYLEDMRGMYKIFTDNLAVVINMTKIVIRTLKKCSEDNPLYSECSNILNNETLKIDFPDEYSKSDGGLLKNIEGSLDFVLEYIFGSYLTKVYNYAAGLSTSKPTIYIESDRFKNSKGDKNSCRFFTRDNTPNPDLKKSRKAAKFQINFTNKENLDYIRIGLEDGTSFFQTFHTNISLVPIVKVHLFRGKGYKFRWLIRKKGDQIVNMFRIESGKGLTHLSGLRFISSRKMYLSKPDSVWGGDNSHAHWVLRETK